MLVKNEFTQAGSVARRIAEEVSALTRQRIERIGRRVAESQIRIARSQALCVAFSRGRGKVNKAGQPP